MKKIFTTLRQSVCKISRTIPVIGFFLTSVLLGSCKKDPFITPPKPDQDSIPALDLPDSTVMTTSYSIITVVPVTIDTLRYYYAYSNGKISSLQVKGKRMRDWDTYVEVVQVVDETYQFTRSANILSISGTDSSGALFRKSEFYFSNNSHTFPEYMLEIDPVNGTVQDSISFHYDSNGYLEKWMAASSGNTTENTILNGNIIKPSSPDMAYTATLSPISQVSGFRYFETLVPPYMEGPADFAMTMFMPSLNLADAHALHFDNYTYTFTGPKLSEIFYENHEHDTWRVKIKLYY